MAIFFLIKVLAMMFKHLKIQRLDNIFLKFKYFLFLKVKLINISNYYI
jgi:hypothetical protein